MTESSLNSQHYEHTLRPVSKLVAYPRNARVHPETQIQQLTKAIKEFGFTSPILIDEKDGVIAGHARITASLRLGMSEVPCIVVCGLSEAKKRALVISDNKIAMNAGWNDEMLIMELGDIASDGLIDMDTLGFSKFEIDTILGELKPTANEESGVSGGSGSLAEKFGIPPFSVLNAREGWWQKRKHAWIDSGIQSELGRGGGEDSVQPSSRKANAIPGGVSNAVG